MSEDEATEKLKRLVARCKECKFATCENCEINWTEVQAIETILDLYQQKCKQNKDAKDYIEYYLLDNMSIEGNAENTHKELKKLYNMLGGDNLR